MKNNFISNREKPIDLKGINRKIKFLALILIALLPLANSLVAQSTVFYDDFNNGTGGSHTSLTSGGVPLMTYTQTNNSTSGAPVIETTLVTGTVPYLKIIGAATGNTAGQSYMTGTLPSPYNATLSANSGLVTWSFNMRQNYGAMSGLSASQRFFGVVLAASEANLLSTTCKGFMISQAYTTTSGYQLVKFANGLGTSGTVTPIIAAPTIVSSKDYMSLKVTYDPSSNTWTLYERTDGTSPTVAFLDPTTCATQIGSPTVDNTSTGIAMGTFGYFVNHPTSATAFNAYVDNFKVTVNTPVTFTSGWPKAEVPTPSGFTAKVNTNVAGTVYYVVVPNGTAAPTSAQVKAGTASGKIVGGSIACASGGTEYPSAVSGLAGSTPYDVYYAAEDISGSNLQASPTLASVTTTAAASAPNISTPTATSITNTSALLGANITSDGGAAITERGTVWGTSTGVGIGDNKVDETGRTTGTFSHTRSSLPPKTQIFYKGYASNSVNTVLTSEASFYTMANEPTTQVTGLTATAASSSSITLNWTAASDADGYIILQRQSATATTGVPSDLNLYSIGAALGNGTVAAYVTSGSATSCTISGLSSSTVYSFKVFSVNSDGINAATYNYFTISAPSANATTLTPPVLSVTPSSLTAFLYETGSGPSASKTYALSGTNLTGFPNNVVVSGSTDFEVSTDNSTFSGSVNVPYSSATLASTTIYVRLKAGLSLGTYSSETVANTGGGASASNVTCSGAVLQAPTTYTWTGSTSTDWQVSTNWSPTRTTPAVNDIILFNNGISNTVTNVPTQSIDQLVISTNTTVELQSATAITLTINGTTGVDFDVQAGSTLNLAQATNAITIAIATGATGSVAGSIAFTTAPHKLIVADASALTFQSGGIFTAGTGFSSNAFGAGTANTVVFANGSKYYAYAGSSPMALTAPASIVVWQTGSTYVHKNIAATPATANRTYANFELDEATGTTCTGSSPFTIDNLIITTGSWGLGIKNTFTINGNISIANGATLNLNPTTAGTIALKGDINVASGGTLNVSPTVTEAITFSGTGAQAVNNAGTFSSTSGASYIVANTVGVNIASNVSIPTLTVNSGGILNVNGGKQLTVGTTLSNSGTLNLLSDQTNGTATIITPSTLGGTGGTYNVSQYLSAVRNWYISSPITGGLSSTFNAANSSNKVYWYDEVHGTSAPWPTISDNATGLTVMKGYVANMAVDGAVTFSGTLNTGSQTINVSRTSGQDKEGFNLIGNPYASYLDWDQATKSASLQTSIWQRTKNGGDAWVFDTYNSTGNQYLNNSGKGINNHIPPMQAFWVRVDNGFSTGSVTVDNTMRSHQGSVTILGNPITDPVFKSPTVNTLTQSVLRLQVSNGTNTDETLIYSNASASNSFDAYDSPKMFNNSASVAEIFTVAGTEDVSINGLNTIPNDTEISLGFSTLSSGNFSIKASQIINLAPGTQVILNDYADLNNPLTADLSDGNSYSFTSDATSNNTSRFTLVFRAPSIATGINTVNGNVWISTNANGQLLINGTISGETLVSIYNAVGQRVAAKNLTTNINVLDTRLVPGVYTITLTNAGKSSTTKVIIK